MFHFALFSSRTPTSIDDSTVWGHRGLIATMLIVMTCSSPSGQMLSGGPSPLLVGPVAEFVPGPEAPAQDSRASGDLKGADRFETSGSSAPRQAPREAQEHWQTGWLLLSSFDWRAAERHFTHGDALDAPSALNAVGLARAYLGMESLNQARDYSRRALQRTDGTVGKQRLWAELTAHQVDAAMAWQQGSRDEHRRLLTAIEEGIRRFPADPALYVLRGQVDWQAMGSGRDGDEGTILWYRKALELDPDDVAAHHHLVYLLQSQGRAEAARQHAERYAQLKDGPQSNRLLVRVLLQQGEPRLALERLQEADRRHRAGGHPVEDGWGDPADMAQHLRLLVAVEEGLGELATAHRHAEELFALASRGRNAGFDCLPFLEQLQQRQSYEETLIYARRCEAKASLLGQVVGAVFRGEAQLAMGHSLPARRALEEGKTAYRQLVADLDADPREKAFAQAAQHSLSLLQGKLELLLGDPLEGERQLADLTEQLAAGGSLDDWLVSRQQLREISALADRAGRFGLSIASSRALERLTPTGLMPIQDVPRDDSRRLASTRSWQPTASSWVVWTER